LQQYWKGIKKLMPFFVYTFSYCSDVPAIGGCWSGIAGRSAELLPGITEFIGLGTEPFKLFGLFKLLFSVKCNRFGTIFIKDRCF